VLSDVAYSHTLALLLAEKVSLGRNHFHERVTRVPQSRGTGENVVYTDGYDHPIRTMVDGWISFRGHCKNLFGNLNHMRTAFEYRGNLWYGAQFFGLF
jgi:uncharacterized protein YkwD